MRLATECPACGRKDFFTKPGEFAPFVIHRAFGYPPEVKTLPLQMHSCLCESCWCSFSGWRLEKEEMGRLYDGYRGPQYNALRVKYEPAYEDIAPDIDSAEAHASREDVLTRFLSKHLKFEEVKVVLDYGGDRGQHIPKALACAVLWVYDISGVTPLTGIYQADEQFSDYGCWPNPCDLVLCQHVLEHLSDPYEVVNNIAWSCKDDGYVCLVVPLDIPEGEQKLWQAPFQFHEHITHFNPTSLKALIDRWGEYRYDSNSRGSRIRRLKLLDLQVLEAGHGLMKGKAVYTLAKKVVV